MTNAEVVPKTPEFDLADRCVKARDVAGLTQQELSDQTGISVSTITRYETRKTTRPSKLVLGQWALACAVPYEWLRFGAGEGSKKPRSSTRRNRKPRGGIAPGHTRPGGAASPELPAASGF